MSLDDEIRRIMHRIYRKVWELRKEIEEVQETLFSRTFHTVPAGPVEPLHSLYEFPDEYVLVIDIPEADSSSLTVLVGEEYLEVRAKISVEKMTGYPFYPRLVREEASYVKRVTIPLDADISDISYKFDRGRLIFNIPKKRLMTRR